MKEQNDIFELFQEMVNKNPKLFPHEEKKEGKLLFRNSNLEHLQEKKKRIYRKGGR